MWLFGRSLSTLMCLLRIRNVCVLSYHTVLKASWANMKKLKENRLCLVWTIFEIGFRKVGGYFNVSEIFAYFLPSLKNCYLFSRKVLFIKEHYDCAFDYYVRKKLTFNCNHKEVTIKPHDCTILDYLIHENYIDAKEILRCCLLVFSCEFLLWFSL